MADDLDLTPDRDEIDVPGETMPEDLIERSELAVHLRPGVFPASPAALVETAREQGAPPELVDRLQRLPEAAYHTVQEVWTAMGGPTEARRAGAPAPEPAPRPAVAATPEPAAPPWVDRAAEGAGKVTETAVRVMIGVPVAILRSVTRRLHPGR